jgi:hypothetical protein
VRTSTNKESAMRTQGNSWWCLEGSLVKLTHGLPAPRRLDLENANDLRELTRSDPHFHRWWRGRASWKLTLEFSGGDERPKMTDLLIRRPLQ